MKIADTEIKYISGGKHQLVEDVSFKTEIHPQDDIITRFVELKTNGLLTLKEGFFWDGASGPTPIDPPSSRRAAAIHDGLYRLAQKNLIGGETNRRKTDRIFHDYLIHDGMWNWRATIWTRMVRRFAKKSYTRRKKVHTAP